MSEWVLRYDGYDPEHERLREALCTLGNGVFATRGAAPECVASERHYPGTYIAGAYNRVTSEIDGHVVEDESLVNAPNWLPLTFRLTDAPGDAWFDIDHDRVEDYTQQLDLRHGMLHRRFTWRAADGRQTRVTQRRLVSMADPHLAALETTFVALNWSGSLTVRHALDGSVQNSGVERYGRLESQHLAGHEVRAEGNRLGLVARTNQSRIRIGLASRMVTHGNGGLHTGDQRVQRLPDGVTSEFEIDLAEGTPVTVEKTVALYTSRHRAIGEPALEAWDHVERAPDVANLARAHVLRWEQMWRRFDIEIEATEGSELGEQLLLRLHLFHLVQVASPHAPAVDAGVPARGLHGEAYRGHVFWDEMFMYPLLTLRAPRIARALLMYRYDRLETARAIAREQGYAGAIFPWQSGSNGREETPSIHLNPRSGRWLPDHSYLQRHINAAVAYSAWRYFEVTGDREFLAHYGADLLLETARFFASAATYNRSLDRYELRQVLGPDEYHDALPDSDDPGLPNNTYTNVMAAWTLQRALDVLDALNESQRRDVEERLHVDSEECEHWWHVAHRMRVVFHEDGIVTQFEGYEALEEFDWEGYRERYGNIQRLDRILEAEGDSANRYRLSKQADVLMLCFLFSDDELRDLFRQLGYDWTHEDTERTVDFYMHRTSHGSTLSAVVHAWVLSRLDRTRSWEFLQHVLVSDVADVQGGTTPEGIHMGAMAGSADIVLRCYPGLEVRDGVLRFDPLLPDELRCVRFPLAFRGTGLTVEVTDSELTLVVERSDGPPFHVAVRGRVHEVAPGSTWTFPLGPVEEGGAAVQPEVRTAFTSRLD